MLCDACLWMNGEGQEWRRLRTTERLVRQGARIGIEHVECRSLGRDPSTMQELPFRWSPWTQGLVKCLGRHDRYVFSMLGVLLYVVGVYAYVICFVLSFLAGLHLTGALFMQVRGKQRSTNHEYGEHGATGTCSAYLAITARVVLGKCTVMVVLSPR